MHILSNRTSSCYNGYNTVIIIIVADSRGIHVRAVTRTRPPRHPPQTEGAVYPTVPHGVFVLV